MALPLPDGPLMKRLLVAFTHDLPDESPPISKQPLLQLYTMLFTYCKQPFILLLRVLLSQ